LATETSQKIISEAKAEANLIKERTAANVEMEWERAESEMRNAIIEVSAIMAEKYMTEAINKEAHDRLIAEAMVDLERVAWRD
jgi:F0F1-type ATP synthase membrane subunit b/b'